MTTPAVSLNPFLAMVSALEDGALIVQAGDELKALVSSMHDQQKSAGKAKGELVLKIILLDDGKVVEAIGKVEIKKPKATRQRSFLYRNTDNTLTRSNPAQVVMDLQPATTDAAGGPKLVTTDAAPPTAKTGT